MQAKSRTRGGLIVAIGAAMLAGTALCAADTGASSVPATGGRVVTLRAPRFLPSTAQSGLQPVTSTDPSPVEAASTPLTITTSSTGGGDLLPLWTFDIQGSRDNDHHNGTIVGHSPFKGTAAVDKVPVYLVPLFIRTHRVATSIDPKTLIIKTQPGDVTVDPTQADQKCLQAPNNIPVTLVEQSPVLTPAHFVFGGHDFGTTQYIDAFQRANFAKVLGPNVDQYHLLLAPVRVLSPIFIDVPPNEGLAITEGDFFQAFNFSICAPFQLVDINWFDAFVQGTVIPRLAAEGVDSTTLPVFVAYEASWPVADVTNLNNCCAVGYHNATGGPLPTHTYGVVDFDRTGFYVGPPAGLDTEVLAHEVGEWANDPFGSNGTAPWGNTGQVAGCQANLEVGDPLTGTDVPPVKMPNGFTYHLQELAFFSWFFGRPSVGVNGWFSNNGTFLKDAGPPCP